MKFKLSFLFLLFSFITLAQRGTVTGTVSDKDLNNEPLPFANVSVKGTTIGVTTDIQGKYKIAVPEGSHTLVFTFLGYETKEVKFTIAAGEIKEINQSIGSGSVKMEDVVIKATVSREKETALMLEQKKAVEIKQSIGAQEMARKGVSDVEEGLTKVSGIVKVDSRGIFVRGLEDRYNNLLINDLAAPTNNPFKKIIPLDIFSTDIVSIIDVYKTFNPNIYGDFAGGTFNIVTSNGSKSTTKLSLGAGYTTNSSFKDFLLATDANNVKGFLGYNGKDRELPSVLQGVDPTSYSFTGTESQQYFKSGFNAAQTKSPLNSSVGLLHSEKFDLNKNRKISYLFSLNFDNEYFIKKGLERNFDIQSTGMQYSNDFVATDYQYKTSTSSLLNLAYKSNRLRLASNTFFIKTTENSIKDQFGSTNRNLHDRVIRTNQFTNSDYLNTQLNGEYDITASKNHTAKTAISFAKTAYSQPDRKFFEGAFNPSTNEVATTYAGSSFIRQYLDINSNHYISALGEYSIKFGSNDRQNKLSLGYNGYSSVMESSYRFIAPRSANAPIFATDINTIDTRINADLMNGSFFFQENSNENYKVKLAEGANAGYANLLWNVGDNLEVNGGLRFENSTKEYQYRTLGDKLYKKKSNSNNYFLPSLNVKYAFSQRTNLRFAASKTYTKPVIMEAFPLTYINADGTSIQGNVALKNSDNYNADFKFEFFPSNKEMLAIGAFGKKIENPIERNYISNATTSTVASFLNSQSATIYGVEAEFVLDLGRIDRSFSNFSLGLNTTVMDSNVKISPTFISVDSDYKETVKESIETHTSRKLQGASNFIINSDLKYQFDLNEKWSNTLTLVYGVSSKRIYAVGTNGQDHIYELPFHQLDFVWGSKLSDHVDVKLSVDNILNPTKRLELGENSQFPLAEDDYIHKEFKKGTGISLKLNYTF